MGGGVEGMPNRGITPRVLAGVEGYDIDISIFFGAPEPDHDVAAAAEGVSF